MTGPESRVSADESDELLRRCQRGDEDALGLLVLRHQRRLYHLARRVLGDAGRAEDAVADALVKVWDRCRQWRGEAPAEVWIHRLALRTVLDHARRLRVTESLSADHEILDTRLIPPEQLAEEERRRELRRRLDAALAELSAEDRALLHLHYFDGLSLAEIEQWMGVSRDALKMRLMRARQRLRPFLEGCDELL